MQGGKGMKKVAISGIIVILVIFGMGMSYMLFRGGRRTEEEQKISEEGEKRMENLMKPGQEEEADDTSKSFSDTLNEKAGLTVDPQNIVSVGNPIISGNYSFTVNSWNVSKESPGYALPEGIDLSGAGPQMDANGNITNEYSYIVVNITVENKAEGPITDLLWGYLKLKTFETSDFISEVRYLGEETPRAYGHEYSMETFEAGETKSYPLIFFMPDEMVKNQELYLEINATGIAYDTSDSEFSVMRYIILN